MFEISDIFYLQSYTQSVENCRDFVNMSDVVVHIIRKDDAFVHIEQNFFLLYVVIKMSDASCKTIRSIVEA